MDATKPYKFAGFGAMDATKPYQFTGFRNLLLRQMHGGVQQRVRGSAALTSTAAGFRMARRCRCSGTPATMAIQ